MTSPNPNPKPGNKKSTWAIGAAALYLLAKLKFLLPLLKLGKVGGTIVSMLVTVGAYALVSPIPFAIGFVILLLVHEWGHVLAAKRKRLPVSAPVFIPFLGALITLKRNPSDARTEAYVAFGGPLVGAAGATIAFCAGLWLNSPVIVSVAYVGFFLNLLNLLPIHPLDGGRIVTAVSRWLWLAGLIGGFILLIKLGSFLFWIIWVWFAWDLYKKFIKYRKKGPVLVQEAVFRIPLEPLVAQGMWIPGEEHKREIPFTVFTELTGPAEGRPTVLMQWDAIGFEGRIALPRQSTVKRAMINGVKQLTEQESPELAVRTAVEYSPYENDRYFEVPTSVRWKYGIAYLALGAYLIVMMNWIHGLEL